MPEFQHGLIGSLELLMFVVHVSVIVMLLTTFSIAAQPRRYACVGLATAASFIPALVIIHLFGWSQFIEAANSLAKDSPYGLLISMCAYTALASPIVGLAAAYELYQDPPFVIDELLTIDDVKQQIEADVIDARHRFQRAVESLS